MPTVRRIPAHGAQSPGLDAPVAERAGEPPADVQQCKAEINLLNAWEVWPTIRALHAEAASILDAADLLAHLV